MAQIHFDEKPVHIQCMAEMWGELKTAVITVGNPLTVSLDQNDFLELYDEMTSVKHILGW